MLVAPCQFVAMCQGVRLVRSFLKNGRFNNSSDSGQTGNQCNIRSYLCGILCEEIIF